MSTSEAMIANIIENPQDDGPRLVYADWLEEQGRCDRAEFIRVQIELANRPSIHDVHKLECRAAALLAANFGAWTDFLPESMTTKQCPHCSDQAPDYETNVIECRQCECTGIVSCQDFVTFHRGFVSQVECRLADWHGEPCPERYGDGWHKSPDYVSQKWACETCHGTGRTPGLGAVLLRRAPIERVVVTDHKPMASQYSQDRRLFAWRTYPSDSVGGLPEDIFRDLRIEAAANRIRRDDGSYVSWKYYETAHAANAALSDALIKLAREQIGRTISWRIS